MVTVAFVDIRGFTALADRSTAREAVAYLNEFFAVAVPVVSEHGGKVNKLLGDGLLAVFDAHGHAAHAVGAARALISAVDARLGGRCRVGVGVNSGLVLVGTIGAAGVVEHGVIGDPVNVAARVQDATRELGEPLLLTEATRLLLDGDGPRLEARGTLSLRGKARPVAVYAAVPDFVTVPGRAGRRTELG
jgi:adenylate cyclase